MCETGAMKKTLFTALLALTPFAARAQQASDSERQLVDRVAQCLVAGLPEDWRTAVLRLELDAPGADNGTVSYLFLRSPEAEKFESFSPCDAKAPAVALLDSRKDQAPERRNWKLARLTLHRDGMFEVKYEY